MPAVTALDLLDEAPSETSSQIRQRVSAARAIQQQRFERLGCGAGVLNATCRPTILSKITAPDDAGKALLKEAAHKFNLSARGFHKALRVARTLADLEGNPTVERAHLAEALSYRSQTQKPLTQQASSGRSFSVSQ